MVKRQSRDEGAAAVEFALVCIPLFMFIAMLVEFGLVFDASISISHAAHEAARTAAFHTGAGNPIQTAKDTAAPTVTLTSAEITELSNCVSSTAVTEKVKITHQVPTPLFGLFGVSSVTIHGTGVEACY